MCSPLRSPPKPKETPQQQARQSRNPGELQAVVNERRLVHHGAAFGPCNSGDGWSGDVSDFDILLFCVFRSFSACLSGNRPETGYYWSRHRFTKERRHALLRTYHIQALYCIFILLSGNVIFGAEMHMRQVIVGEEIGALRSGDRS